MTKFTKPIDGHWSSDEGTEMANRYVEMDRADLAYGQKTDLELANAIFMVGRGDLDLIGLQTAAKERIRWLSAQLAALRAHNSDSAEPVGYIRPETLHKLREGDAGPVVGVAAYDTTIPLYLASPPAKEVENRIKELEDALRPFAKCSELYPNAKGRGNTGFAGLHDARCTVTFDDYHRAHAALTNRTPDDEVGNG